MSKLTLIQILGNFESRVEELRLEPSLHYLEVKTLKLNLQLRDFILDLLPQ